MNRAYWESVAADYEREVLSVFDHDTDGLVGSRIRAAGATKASGRATDLGCGVGKFTPLLAQAFARVEACDRSVRGLAVAREHCRGHGNVGFWQFDLACDPVPFAPVDFALCVNVLIMPALDERMRAWRAVTNQVVRGGSLLLVVPSLESVQYGYFRALEADLHAGNSCATALQRSAPHDDAVSDLHQGVHQLDGLRTKHYLREELERMLPAHEFDVTELRKLEYRADAFADREAAGASAASVPWDWLVVARRR